MDDVASSRARPRRRLRRIAAALAAALALLVAVAVGTFLTADWKAHANRLAAEVGKKTGRSLTIAGPVDVGLFPPRVIANDLRFQNAPWGSAPDMARIRRAVAVVALRPLLSGVIETDLEMIEPEILVETRSNGVGNWALEPDTAADAAEKAEPPPPEAGIALAARLRTVRLRNGSLTYRRQGGDRVRRVGFDTLSLDPRDDGRSDLKLAAKLDGSHATLKGEIGDPLRAVAARAALPFRLQADLLTAQVHADGQVDFAGDQPVVEATIRAEVREPNVFAEGLGLHVPALPPLAASGRLRAAKQVVELSALDVNAGGSAGKGDLEIDYSGPVARVKGSIHAATIDVPKLAPATAGVVGSRPPGAGEREAGAGGTAGSTAAGPSRRVFSSTPLAPLALAGTLADIDLRVDRLVLTPTLLLESVNGRIRADGKRIAIDPMSMRIGGGLANLQTLIDLPRGEPPRHRSSLAGSGIDLGQMLTALGRPGEIDGGKTELKADLRSAGSSLAELAGSLEGSLRVIVGPARVNNRKFDLGGDIALEVLDAVDPTRKRENYTSLRCAVVNVPIRQGIVTIENTVAAETDRVGMSVAGVVNLKTETLDLAIKPSIRRGVTGVSLSELVGLVRVRGTIADPRMEIDPEQTAKALLDLGLGIATSGMSVLASRLFAATVMDAPCDAALGKVSKAQPGGGGEARQRKDAPVETPAIPNPFDILRQLIK